jgi:hypothetical protein
VHTEAVDFFTAYLTGRSKQQEGDEFIELAATKFKKTKEEVKDEFRNGPETSLPLKSPAESKLSL